MFPRGLSKEVREARREEEETKHAAFADKDLPRLTLQRNAMWNWVLHSLSSSEARDLGFYNAHLANP